jgi:hypothetical protein
VTAPASFEGERFLEDLRGLDRAGLAVCAFLSAGDGYERYAQRLAVSCRRFGLPHSIWRVRAVHCSISLRGTGDLRCTKPSFIGHCLDQLGGAAVAYVDVDTLFMARPQAFTDARASGCDFAIYNWLDDPHNETYLPANHKLISPDPKSSFYMFSHRVEWASAEQLICSGVTQFYADSAAARALLARWQQTIAVNPRAADDQCLNFAYNNPGEDATAMRSLWLDKAYARSPWWPHVEPVVLHPAIPALGQLHAAVTEAEGRRSIYLERCTPNDTPTLFPRDGGVDVTSGVTFHIDAQGHPQPAGRYTGRFWIYPEDPAPGELS